MKGNGGLSSIDEEQADGSQRNDEIHRSLTVERNSPHSGAAVRGSITSKQNASIEAYDALLDVPPDVTGKSEFQSTGSAMTSFT